MHPKHMKASKKDYQSLKAVLTSLGVNLTEIDEIKRVDAIFNAKRFKMEKKM